MTRLDLTSRVLLALAALAVLRAPARGEDRTFDGIEAALERPAEVKSLALDGPVPREVERLPNLEVLMAKGPLPDQALRLPRLTTLSLYGKKITRLPDWIGSLTALKDLSLRATAVKTLPPAIGQLVNLERLQLENAGLAALPAELGKLKKVRELDLGYNRALEALPAGIGGMEGLEVLAADNTGLLALPAELGNLKKLRQVDLTGARLASFPWEAFSRLPGLEQLELGGNPLRFPPRVGALEGVSSSYRRAKKPAPLPAGKPVDPPGIKARILELARLGARDQLVRYLQELELVPAKEPDGQMVETDGYVTESTKVDADLFFANLLAEPPGAPVEKEAVLQVRTSGDVATAEYYALALFRKEAGKWTAAGTITEDGRSTAGPYLRFSFVPLFKKTGISAIQGIITHAALGGNQRTERQSVVLWKMNDHGADELVREEFSLLEYQSSPHQVRKDETGAFKLDIKADSASLIIKQRKAGKVATRTVKVY